MKRSAAIVIVIVVLVGVGIFLATRSNNPKTTNSTTASTSSTASGTQRQPSPAPAHANQITLQNFAFSPADITVKKGTTVTWTNNDSVTHTVSETDGRQGPDSGNLPSGQSYTFTFTTTGTFHYRCNIHPEMTGTVTVTD